MCPTDKSPVKPTTRFRLTAKIAQIQNTVPSVIANPTPCHNVNTMAHVMMNRFDQSSRFPRSLTECIIFKACVVTNRHSFPWQYTCRPER